MITINNFDEAEEILNLPIEGPNQSQSTAEMLNTEWELVGAVSKVHGYNFQQISKLTMYSSEYDIRRWPTAQELDEATELEFEEEEEEIPDEEAYCPACVGTGISPSGLIDSACEACFGSGQKK